MKPPKKITKTEPITPEEECEVKRWSGIMVISVCLLILSIGLFEEGLTLVFVILFAILIFKGFQKQHKILGFDKLD